MDVASGIIRKPNPTAHCLILWLLRSFCPFLCNLPWGLGTGACCRCIRWNRAPQLWILTGCSFLKRFLFIAKVSSLERSKTNSSLGPEDTYSECRERLWWLVVNPLQWSMTSLTPGAMKFVDNWHQWKRIMLWTNIVYCKMAACENKVFLRYILERLSLLRIYLCNWSWIKISK